LEVSNGGKGEKFNYFRDLMQRLWHMDKQAQGKRLQWKALNIIQLIHKGVLFQEP